MNKEIKYKPTKEMAKEAKKGLDLHKKYKRGGTLVGLARANQFASQKEVGIDIVARTFAFFSRHRVDKQASGFNSGEDGFPSNGRIAWDLWGGDAGDKWSKKIWEKYKQNNKTIAYIEKLFDENSSDELMKSLLKTEIIENLLNKDYDI